MQNLKKKARTGKKKDAIDLTSEHERSFDTKQADKKAQEVTACDTAMLAPNWHRDDSKEQQQQKVLKVLFAHHLKLKLTKANKSFLSAMFKPNNGSKCAALPRRKILVNAYLPFGKICWENMTSLNVVKSLG